jgi:excisionase family DNA binding protein
MAVFAIFIWGPNFRYDERRTPMKALYDVKAAAQALAVSPWTIRAYIRDGKLRAVRLGRLVRLEEAELERFVAQSQAPVVQIQKGQE